MTTPSEIAKTLTEAQRRIILALGDDSDFGYLSFKHCAENANVDPAIVRTEVHGLRRLNLVTFGSGLCNEDGEFYGSGYALNPTGLQVKAILDNP